MTDPADFSTLIVDHDVDFTRAIRWLGLLARSRPDRVVMTELRRRFLQRQRQEDRYHENSHHDPVSEVLIGSLSVRLHSRPSVRRVSMNAPSRAGGDFFLLEDHLSGATALRRALHDLVEGGDRSQRVEPRLAQQGRRIRWTTDAWSISATSRSRPPQRETSRVDA